jgi:hypothetical protein
MNWHRRNIKGWKPAWLLLLPLQRTQPREELHLRRAQGEPCVSACCSVAWPKIPLGHHQRVVGSAGAGEVQTQVQARSSAGASGGGAERARPGRCRQYRGAESRRGGVSERQHGRRMWCGRSSLAVVPPRSVITMPRRFRVRPGLPRPQHGALSQCICLFVVGGSAR